jgi:hypothetical protein
MAVYCAQKFLGEKKKTHFFRPSLGKVCPFTLENYIYFKALKTQRFPNN